MYDVAHQARFVDVKDFGIDSGDALYGMLCGMVSQNYDIEAVFIDAFLKIVKLDVEELKELIERLKRFPRKTASRQSSSSARIRHRRRISSNNTSSEDASFVSPDSSMAGSLRKELR